MSSVAIQRVPTTQGFVACPIGCCCVACMLSATAANMPIDWVYEFAWRRAVAAHEVDWHSRLLGPCLN